VKKTICEGVKECQTALGPMGTLWLLPWPDSWSPGC